MTRTTPELAPRLQSFRAHQQEFATYDLRATGYTADLRWNRVSDLRSLGRDLTTENQRPLNGLEINFWTTINMNQTYYSHSNE
ncbi:hypothetical protein AVEN_200809-1 [Araneus ventricosus]|uniref:Uncharacterized protein n=1 Tax=Araneus ventricosus TaxID=182803 RepID=A0A4Y2CIK0_ARAVE|nr:hypothetical protein AVEN_200809-1 [Araneus ventricosus]